MDKKNEKVISMAFKTKRITISKEAMKHLIFTIAISFVFAQHHHDIAQIVDTAFLRLDLHPKDGLLEMNELTTIFTQRDTDGNGKLSYVEFTAHAHDNPMRHDLFNYFDTNKDGFLTKEEMVDNNYHAMDHNGDNQVRKMNLPITT
uniref:EF-hand domain-containing protein n=1 Tax=Magallana gigas TaxID=29159 RepID=K1QJN5_MAGGI